MWFVILVNLSTAIVNLVLIFRNIRLRKRERQEYEESAEKLMTDLAPAIAFVVTMRDMPGTPESIRRFAAAAVPKNIDVTMTAIPMPGTDEKVH